MTTDFVRSDYEVLTEEKQNEFFDENVMALYKRGLKVKDKIIKALNDAVYIRKNIPIFNTVTGNSMVSIIVDSFVSGVIEGDYVDKVGYDIIFKEHGKDIRISSKSLRKMFLKTNGKGTNSIIDSNKLASSTKYNDEKHTERTESDVYLLIQTEGQMLVGLAPKSVYDVYHKETGSNTTFIIPNDSYIKFIVSREDKIFYDDNYISTNPVVLDYIKATNALANYKVEE